MLRMPSMMFAAMVLTSAAALAADTPNPAGGEDALPSGSNAATPSSPPAASDADMNKGAPATSPGEENKGKPPVSPQ